MAEAQAFLDSDVIQGIDSVHADVASRQRELLRHVAEVDRRKLWERDGCRDMGQWLSGRLGISNWTARRWVVAAHALDRLPSLSDALAGGRLSLDKVVELARFATPADEQPLITWARRVSPAAIRRRADRSGRAAADEVREDERSRHMRWWWFDDGRRLGLEAELPAADGAKVIKAISRVAERIPNVPGDEQPDGWEPDQLDRFEQRCADALVAMSSHSITDDDDMDRATVVVHTTLGPGRWSEIEGGPVLNDEIGRRLACDARLQFVLTDAQGNALGIGRTARDVPLWLMRELRFRDGGCTFPGCEVRTFLQAHHIRHWEFGGPTDIDNLVLTCHFHHKLVHEFGWKVRLQRSTVLWFRPSGELFAPGSDPPPEVAPTPPPRVDRLDPVRPYALAS